MNYDEAVRAECREVQDRTHAGKPARAVIASRVYATDINDLWDALTNAQRIPRWFMPITGELKAGGRYQLEGNAGGVISRCDPPDTLDITWEFAGNVSWLNLRLKAEGDKTRLALEHVMLKDEAGEAHWQQYGPGATGVGWDLSFFGMALHLESGGKAIDLETNEAWMSSNAGKGFMQACADAWGEAHIASGEDSEVALVMAARTGAAYSGGE